MLAVSPTNLSSAPSNMDKAVTNDTASCQARFLNSIADLDARTWNHLNTTDYPFVRYEFLAALEHSGSVGGDSGWEPCHLVLESQGSQQTQVLAILPLYLKAHSYGEYVFDWSWAKAYNAQGLDYYPKLVTAIPFTPCEGPRLLGDNSLWPQAISAIQQFTQANQLSGWHGLFCDDLTQNALNSLPSLSRREDIQFHWFNRNFSDFGDFLQQFRASKRKTVRRERAKVAEQGLDLRWFSGDEITPALWDHFYNFYRTTYFKRSGHGGYLTREFFHSLSAALGNHVLLNLAFSRNGKKGKSGEPIAGALYFKDDHSLYGRYWGCLEQFNHLHFECCYYQGIEYAICHGLKHFNAGAQGEHKLKRGFEPVTTYSYHWLQEPVFHQAVKNFVMREKEFTNQYQLECQQALPFKQDVEAAHSPDTTAPNPVTNKTTSAK